MRETLKIGITCYPSVGGSGIVATELGKQLAKRGHEIHFITSDMPFRLTEISSKIFFHQVELGHYPVFQYPPYDLALANKMAEIIDQEHLDILHVHYAMPHAVCAILAKQMAKHNVKIVTTLHGTDITVLGMDKSFTNMIKFGIEQSDVVTTVSENLKQQTYQELNVNTDIEVVYNFIDTVDYYRKNNVNLRIAYGIKEEEKVLIHISNFRKVKRITDVLLTFKKIAAHMPAKLLLIGDGPEYSEMNHLAERLGIAEHVLFLGKQQNIADLLSIADLKLLLSEKESFGLVLIEAMACGVPCIGTSVGGIPEVIEHGYNGYIVPLNDSESASQYALQLLQDQQKWLRYSKQAIEHVKKNFDTSIIVQQYEFIYQNVLKGDHCNEPIIQSCD
ncbi:N-acetyl-alpha-D-glucosaminyl L-malate synthase BshA [Amphibacillus marinus]|uniref:N-acetyl-alpha-D-glucosaminyl L-malate synthase BshA n=1 Tax=Amphibacillus marinus TaxID=872970 RepID=A0A1H8GI51_9BACI|nr:N-acetyl-alpha-D-glucosaminyl L-malate synthase BshA [Amphibacillus marinus]SEN43445.1 N-acetyl-alpha-D-glucosaminyl L-malate synthase BshA [Amphibacillus marinus]